MKRLIVLLGLIVMLAGCGSQQNENNDQENEESLVQEDEKDYDYLQKMVNHYEDIVDDGLSYAVKNLAKFVFDCENKCQSQYMTYEDAQELVETQAYDEWFNENYISPVADIKPNINWVEFSGAWLGEQNDGSFKLESQFVNNFERDVIDFKFNIHIFDRYDKEIQVIELDGGSIPAQSTQYVERILNVDSEWYTFNCEIVEVEYAEE